MKKIILFFGMAMLCGKIAAAENINLQELDSQARMERPNTNSIMFRRNAEQYKQLSEDEKTCLLYTSDAADE